MIGWSSTIRIRSLAESPMRYRLVRALQHRRDKSTRLGNGDSYTCSISWRGMNLKPGTNRCRTLLYARQAEVRCIGGFGESWIEANAIIYDFKFDLLRKIAQAEEEACAFRMAQRI